MEINLFKTILTPAIFSASCLGFAQAPTAFNERSPIITTQPSDQSVCPGGSATFSVATTGTVLAYQWRNGPVNLVNGGNISGVNSSSLIINPVSLADAGTDYHCVVTGILGENDTSLFVALVEDVPRITTEPISVEACAGDSVSFSVAASGTDLSYQWMQGATSLASVGAISGTTTSTLSISPAAESKAATDYYVVVYGTCAPNDTSELVQLTITPAAVPEAWANSPVCRFGDLNMTTPYFEGATYTWSGPANFSSVSQNPTIMSVSPSNAGTYELVVTNKGCRSTAFKMDVVVDDCAETLWVPEGFSPNGDGINDFLVIAGIENYPLNLFTVYNRWGTKVYEGDAYNNTWNGKATEGLTPGGDDLPAGTYFYTLNIYDGHNPLKGTIYLNK